MGTKLEAIEALSALNAKRQAEAQIARAANCPPWRHAVFGLMMSGLVMSPAFETPVRFAILAALFCLIPIIVQSDRRRMGMFINGYRRGKTRLVAIGIVIVEMALYSVGLVRGLEHHDHVTPLALGLVAFAIGIAGSMLWQRVFVREMDA